SGKNYGATAWNCDMEGKRPTTITVIEDDHRQEGELCQGHRYKQRVTARLSGD
ncbi:hypothetical protein E4U14_005060, partial [Claviceps sp. LM454 group G7]